MPQRKKRSAHGNNESNGVRRRRVRRADDDNYFDGYQGGNAYGQLLRDKHCSR